jgi:hypothetical protein
VKVVKKVTKKGVKYLVRKKKGSTFATPNAEGRGEREERGREEEAEIRSLR